MASVVVLVGGATAPAWCLRAIEALRATGADVRVERRACACDRADAHPVVERITRALAQSVPLLRSAAIASDDVSDDAKPGIMLDLRPCAPHADVAHSWYLRLGDDAGAAPFVGAIAAGERTVAIDLREAGPDGERLIERAIYRLQHGYKATLTAALRDGAHLPARALGRSPASFRPVATAAQRPLGVVDLLRYAAADARVIAAFLFEYFFLEAVWNIGRLDVSPRALVEGATPRATWWPERPGRAFVADPIVARTPDGRSAMLFEYYDPAVGRGTIAAAPLDGSAPPADVIVRDEHLSYPFVVTVDGELYCMPENNQNRTGVPVYRCLEFPSTWAFERMMTPAGDVIDPTVVHYGDRWWLFATRGSMDSNAHLFIWHAPSPFGPWTAHARSPVLTDASAARPAGPFFTVDGVLYRPAQDSSRSYGGALAIARVDELTPETYAETVVRRIEPIRGRYGRGIHTLAVDGDRMYVDGKRYAFSLGKPLRVLAARAKRR